MNFIEGEVLLINKPLTWTSFDVVNKVRYALKKHVGKIKVGHAGTLDPLATGLLILCTGKMTKQIENFQAQEKEYTGTIFIGATTATYDSEMQPDATFETAHITDELLLNTAQKFVGSIEQYPPIFSAVKIDGKAAYMSARNGLAVETKARTVEIKSFELTKIEMPEVAFKVVCSKGTYIRSLANDFGKAMNSGAYLSSLCRTKIGDFKLENAWELDKLIEYLNTKVEIKEES